jgi:predicted transcriptional regulator
MPAPLFTDEQLVELANQGKGVVEIAEELGVGKAAVSRRLKRLKNKVVMPVVEARSGKPLKSPEGRLDAFAQLEHINQIVNTELDFLQESLHECEPLQRPVLQKQQLAHVQEIRAEIKLLVDVAAAVTHYEEVKRFQQIVLEELGNVAPEARDRVIARLEKRSHVGSLLTDR